MVVQPVADSALPIQLSAFLIIDNQGDSASKKLVFWIAVSHSVDSVFVILSGHSCFLSNIFQGFSENRVTVSIPIGVEYIGSISFQFGKDIGALFAFTEPRCAIFRATEHHQVDE